MNALPTDTHLPQAHQAPTHQQSARPADGGGSLWRKTMVLSNAQGQDEAFSIGPDGYVWHYVMGQGRVGAGRLLSTGLAANVFTAAALPDGRRLLMGAQGLEVSCCAEQPRELGGGWATPQRASLRLDPRTEAIERVSVRPMTTRIWLEVVTTRAGADGASVRELWQGAWRDERAVFASQPIRHVSALDEAWGRAFAG
jgi:hypothetical protein